ncbi:MAG: transposase [Epsilonproteobacteria bacterium]|nr:transposase [Campylobacterota bacterium]
MSEILPNCPFCGATKLYTLSTGQLKCSKCKKKFSPKRLQREAKVLHCFCEGVSARECATRLRLNYLTIQRRYHRFRLAIASFMESDFAAKRTTKAFDEYIYLPKSKRRDKRHIFDAFNFLTFNYDDKIYNLLLPDLARYKPAFLEDGLEDIYFKEFERFLRRSHIQSSQDDLIRSFWRYFESFIAKYHGVNRQNFFYYLKEAEFRFNFDCEKLTKIVNFSSRK